MWFWPVVGALVAMPITLAAFVNRRDHKRDARLRDADEMWRANVREHKRDVRAIEGGNRINPDLQWTEWSRRNHPGR